MNTLTEEKPTCAACGRDKPKVDEQKIIQCSTCHGHYCSGECFSLHKQGRWQ